MDLRDVLIASLRELLDVEQQLAHRVLPELLEQTTEKRFREALAEHLEQTHQHVLNVQRVFECFDTEPEATKSWGLEGLRRQHDELAVRIGRPELRDIFNAASAAHTEHYEISAYHSLITTAAILGEPEAVRVLELNLHDEEEALAKLEKSIPERLSLQLAKA
jgi:ferritin-like metal-binding protein YciE